MLEKSQIISISSEVMGGTPVFTGTRVPIQTFLDYLKAGESIDDFLAGFPSVTKEQAIAFLEEAERQLTTAIK
ncbi:MAG: DUF433 domain-containing protein [Cyanobacteria bacterium P01_F01_bin.143]